MITENQIKVLSEEELGYLYTCCNEEFVKSGFTYFSLNILKVFRWEAMPYILNKYSDRLREEYKDMPKNILEKMQSVLK